jgi:hypothetical protein
MIQWRFGQGASPHASAMKTEFSQLPLFSKNKPWGTNEYLLISASVVATVLIIVLATSGHHHDDPPHPGY